MSPDYTRALAAHDAAIARYKAALQKYRLQELGDEEFLVARSAYDSANKIFDQAFAREEYEGNRKADRASGYEEGFSDRGHPYVEHY